MRPSPNILCIMGLTAILTSTQALAESLTGSVGYGQTNIVSTEYKPKTIPSTQLSATFSHVLTGRWSMMAQYQRDTADVMQGFSGGIFYDSQELETHSDTITLDGRPEIVRTPKWWIRTMLGAGMWQISDTLELNNPYLGSKNKTPVQASIYGLNFGVGIYRFVAERFALHGTINEVVATTGQFALSSTALTFGVFWKYD